MINVFKKIKNYFLVLILLFSYLSAFSKDNNQTYTINFKNIAITEYLNFVSKICNINFLYEDTDLNFNVTVISEDDVHPSNVMDTLIQILRIHGLTALQENGNLVIHKNPEVKQLAKIITDNKSLDNAPPIITRVFRIKNAKVDNIASIIKPMISTEALIEISPDTRQLIITDTLSSIRKIGELIEIIDSPQNPLDIEIYKTKENTAEYLIPLISQIMTPIAEGTPFILVPQDLSGSLFIVSTPKLIEKAISVLHSLDTNPQPGTKKMLKPGNIFIYRPQFLAKSEIQKALEQILKNLESSGYSESNLMNLISSAKWLPEIGSFLFTGSTDGITQIKELLTNIDSLTYTDEEARKIGFFTYKPINKDGKYLEDAIIELASNLKNSNIADNKLIETLENVKEIESTGSLLFTGDTNSFTKIKDLLTSIDLPDPNALKSIGKITFYIYKAQNTPISQILNALKNTSDNLKKAKIQDKNLIETIDSVKYIPKTNSLLFTGAPQSLKELQDLISSFDTDLNSEKMLSLTNQFYLYKPANKPLNDLAASLVEIANNLNAANLVNPSFMQTIESMKVIESSNSLLFTGDSDAIKKIDELLKTIDTSIEGSSLHQNIFLYQPQFASSEEIERYLEKIGSNLDLHSPNNKNLKATIDNGKWLADSQSFMFTGSDITINKIKEILSKFDTQDEIQKIKDSYLLYKLQNASGNIIVEDLDGFAERLKKQEIKKPKLLHILENAKWVKETNSILLSGNAKELDEALQIVKDFDTPRTTQEVTAHSDYYLYKPKFASPSFIEQSLKETASNLEKAKLADPNLLNAINGVRIIESTSSLAFTGTPSAIEKIKSILTEVDAPGVGDKLIHKIGKTTFLVYKIEKATPQKIINSIKSFASDLEKSGASDKEFIKTLDSVKYKPEIHSLLFTGTQESLEKTQSILIRLDVEDPSPPSTSPSAYFVYKPKYLSGATLQDVLDNFTSHLQLTGFENPNLYHCIQNMKWDDQTKSLLFSGDEATINEVKNLLATFDIPSAGSKGDIIQPIDDASFLVYKLQYHKGDSIQAALKQIAGELSANGTNVKKSLLSAINSVQWIQVTNSLLCSGDQETMSRLKELISSLDIPLKQVFIEMLVIETSFTNMLNFGLNWGGKYKHKNKFVAGLSNSAPTSSGGTQPFITNLNGLSEKSTNQVQGTSLPFTSGFDLGIIGDIILHKGTSFLSLGSLMQALQQDEEASVIMTPKILAQDNKPSYLFIGQNIPYVGSVTSYQQTVSSNTTNLEYRDVGMEITITPVLGNSDTVSLDINMTRSLDEPYAQTNINVSGVQGITTSKTTMTTTVHIPDKSFLVLSGMGNESKSKVKTGLPCLGGLPLIGAAFSQNDRLNDKKNIVIFIRPHIINSYKDMESVTESSEDFFRDTSGTPGLEADFDEGVDYLKIYDDE